jgi:release factor glutamine methyltransferase
LLLDRRRGQLLLGRHEPIDASIEQRFQAWVQRRARREPAQHIAADQEFFGLSFHVTPDVLIPRPETEMLVQAVLEKAPRNGCVVDLGTGSGCIAIAVAVKRPDLNLRALDRSGAALEIARNNARRHEVGERIEFVEGDFAAPPEPWLKTADLVVSNPPYVSAADWAGLEPEVRDHDPRIALVPGESGLEAYGALIPQARRLLVDGGGIVLELGAGQAAEVGALAQASGFERVRIEPDLNGIPRLLTAVLRSAT